MVRAILFAPLPLLTGCGGHPHVAPGPPGLAYLCGSEPAQIVYGDGGYLPGTTAREADGAAARSRARLTFRGTPVDLVADDAFTDLRYVGQAGRIRIVWTAQAETAQIEWIGPDGETPEQLDCRRVRTVTPDAPTGAPQAHPAA